MRPFTAATHYKYKNFSKKGFVGFKTLCPNFCYINEIISERINYMLHVFIFTPLHHDMWQKNERDEQNKCRSYGTQ